MPVSPVSLFGVRVHQRCHVLCRIVLIVTGSVDPHCRVSHYGFSDRAYDADAAFDDVSWTDWSSSNPRIADMVRPALAPRV
jgi:hypothetical protein